MPKIKPKTTSLSSISADFTDKDWQEVANEKKYYQIVVKLRELRQKIGLTQQQLAERAKLPRATVVKVESGKRNATLETLLLMAQAMGKDLEIRLW